MFFVLFFLPKNVKFLNCRYNAVLHELYHYSMYNHNDRFQILVMQLIISRLSNVEIS